MPRARMRAGEIGAISITVLPNGRIRAHARMRDEVGALVRLTVVRATETQARAALGEQADVIRFGSAGGARLTAASTIAQAAAVFLDDKARAQTIETSTLESYEATVANVIVPACGALLLIDLTALRCGRILRSIREDKSLSAARKARSVFSQICATGIEHGVLAANPVRDAPPLPLRTCAGRGGPDPATTVPAPTPHCSKTPCGSWSAPAFASAKCWPAPLRRGRHREPADPAHRRHHHPDPRRRTPPQNARPNAPDKNAASPCPPSPPRRSATGWFSPDATATTFSSPPRPDGR